MKTLNENVKENLGWPGAYSGQLRGTGWKAL